ncbi:MAG: hypothetical protein HY329_10085 [Chloroflexi bacterium]|nr:hypothetical protein [Chloroflexota bacterium]
MQDLPSPTVAVINTSEDVAELLGTALSDEGYDTAVGYVVDFRAGRQDLDEFLRRHRPQVIIWDIAIPYALNWEYFLRVRETHGDCSFVLTTTNKDALESIVGPTETTEIVGRPFDLEHVIQAVQRVIARLNGKSPTAG